MQSTFHRLLAALAIAAALTPSLSVAAPPEGKIAINYSRCDNNYKNWGLHVWRNPSIPLPGVEWGKPMEASGTNDFGVFWMMDFAEFGNSGNVNYIIHRGDSKEQGGKDMKFDGKTTKEIWVNSGDSTIYTSLEDAQKARAAKPCP